jgi:hypothetical protein
MLRFLTYRIWKLPTPWSTILVGSKRSLPTSSFGSNKHFSSDMVRDINLGGERFLLMDGTYLFVSPLLRQRLDASPFKYLRFTEGLSEFAGQET